MLVSFVGQLLRQFLADLLRYFFVGPFETPQVRLFSRALPCINNGVGLSELAVGAIVNRNERIERSNLRDPDDGTNPAS